MGLVSMVERGNVDVPGSWAVQAVTQRHHSPQFWLPVGISLLDSV